MSRRTIALWSEPASPQMVTVAVGLTAPARSALSLSKPHCARSGGMVVSRAPCQMRIGGPLGSIFGRSASARASQVLAGSWSQLELKIMHSSMFAMNVLS
jgi:hypothetical protein